LDQQSSKYSIPGEAAEQHYRAYEKALNDAALEAGNNYEAMIRQMAYQAYQAAIRSGKPQKDSRREASLTALKRLGEDQRKGLALIAELKERLESSGDAGNIMIEYQLAAANGRQRKIESLMVEALLGSMGPTSNEVWPNSIPVKAIVAVIAVILLLIILL